ncbi:Collagen alpha-2(V) chain [Homalodisca vitripennis]|nr:Collagen alpha-2(V) chain [Homalodisca vitripennis]
MLRSHGLDLLVTFSTRATPTIHSAIDNVIFNLPNAAVSVVSTTIQNHYGQEAARKPEWGRTTISYSTDKSLRLPITDIALRDIGKSDQSFWLEIGMACFK